MLAGNIAADFTFIYLFKNIYGVALATVVPVLTGVLIGHWALCKYYPFKLTDIITTGYTEVKELLQQTLRKFNVINISTPKEAKAKGLFKVRTEAK